MLSISPYRPLKVGKLVGLAADFRLRNAEKGTIYQTVRLTYKADDDDEADRWEYTEGWLVDPRRKKLPIDQGGTDAFLLHSGDVAAFGGKITFETVAWFEAGAIDKQMKKGRGSALWGTLYGREALRPVPKGARTVRRRVTARWKKGGDVVWKTKEK